MFMFFYFPIKFNFSLCFILSFIAISIETAFSAQFGLEVELASLRLMESDPNKIPNEMYSLPLEAVREAFGDFEGKIEIRPWMKAPHLREAVYVDPMGRHWQVMPEYVNTASYDGFELVTPPFQN